jgi:hypothetical protein
VEIRAVAVGFALGIAVGIVTAWALESPITTAAVLIVCLFVVAAFGVSVYRQRRRRKSAIAILDACNQDGMILRQRILADPATLPRDQDRAYWERLVNEWDALVQQVIHEHADDWHQKYLTWPKSIGNYVGVHHARSSLAKTMDARLEALAEIRTRV